MLDGWKIVARTDFRTSLQKEASGETLEILYHDGLCDEYDVHSMMYSSSPSAGAFSVLNCDGLFEIDSSQVRVSPPPSPAQLMLLERPVCPESEREKFFSIVRQAVCVLPKRLVVENVVDFAEEQGASRPSRIAQGLPLDLPPRIVFLDIACANGKRVLEQAARTSGECVGIDMHPPIYCDCANARFFRADAGQFLKALRQRPVEIAEANADFFLGSMAEPDATALLDLVIQMTSDSARITLCEPVSVAKKLAATLRMFPGVSVSAPADFCASKEAIAVSTRGRKAIEKFLSKHPDYEKENCVSGAAPASEAVKTGAEGKESGANSAVLAAPPENAPQPQAPGRIVPASMPIMVRATKTRNANGAAEAGDKKA